MNLDLITSLQTDFGRIYDENFKLRSKEIYSKEIDSFRKRLEEAGISSKLSPKEIELKLQQAYELLMKTPKDANRPNDMPANATLTPQQLADLTEQAEKRAQQKENIQAREKLAVEEFEKRGKEIFAEQQRIQSEIAKAEAAKDKLKDKVLYAKVVLPEPLPLDDLEVKDLEVLRKNAQNDTPPSEGELSPKQILINDLAQAIKPKIAPLLKNATAEEIELEAYTAAVEITNKIAKPEIELQVKIQTAIYNTIAKDASTLPKILRQDDALLIAAKNGSALLALDQYDRTMVPDILRNFFGVRMTAAILGPDPEQIQVILSEEKTDASNKVELYNLNLNYEESLKEKDKLLTSVQDFGVERARELFTNPVRAYASKEIAVLQKAGKLPKFSPGFQGILARHGLGPQVEFVYTSRFGKLVRDFAPETTAYWKTAAEVFGIPIGIGVASTYIPLRFGGGIQIGNIAAIQRVQLAKAPFTYAVATGKKVAVSFGNQAVSQTAGQAAGQAAAQTVVKTGLLASISSFLVKGAAAIGVGLGVFTAGVSTAATLALTAVGKLINWPKVKQWFIDNKEMFVIFGAGAGLMVGGPVAGLVTGGLLLAATGTLGAFAVGTMGVLGFIGRSIGVAIATPVIVTLLVLPPLVAFIMLVINNSAYVVPPGPLYDISGNPNGGSIHFECTDEKGPVGIDGPNSSSPIANRAWEITYDLYQGFWCFWNRSPIAPAKYFPNDTLKYPDGYPSLFDYEAFLKDPNNTPASGNLFWCTYLVVKSYQDSGVDVPFELNSQSLFDAWPRKKILPNDATPDNVVPGSVIFFQVHGPGHPTRLNHVGIVYSVDQGGIVFVESNAGVKSQSAAFVSGKISRNIGDMEIKGFGLPN